jgi:hypothetical protein
MSELYTRSSRASSMAIVAAIALLVVTSSTSFAQAADPFKPVTADGSCEFGFRVTTPKAWESTEASGPGGWIDFVLRKAVQYCKDGDTFMIIRGGDVMVGYVHDYFSVAALLCKRGEVKEDHPLNRLKEKQYQFSCPISKIEGLKGKLAEGKLLYHYPDDWVDPRAGDTGAMRRAPGAEQMPTSAPPQPSKNPPRGDECRDPKAPQYAERCGIPLLTSPSDKQR